MSIKSYQKYLTCANDTNEANHVCGKCGKPVCEDHYTRVNTFTGAFSTDAWGLILAIIVLIIGVPIFFLLIAPNILSKIRVALLPGTPLFLKTGLVYSSILFGLILIPKLWYRTTEGNVGYQPLVRTLNSQVICDECQSQSMGDGPIRYGILGVSIFFVVMGVFGIVSGPNFSMLTLVTIGVGLYIIKDDLLVHLL